MQVIDPWVTFIHIAQHDSHLLKCVREAEGSRNDIQLCLYQPTFTRVRGNQEVDMATGPSGHTPAVLRES